MGSRHAHWQVAAVSIDGFSHEERNEGCQDAHDVRERDGWLLAIVADGAGSTPFGGDGARLACKGVQDRLEDRIRDRPIWGPRRLGAKAAKDLIHQAISGARDDILAEARARASNPDQFHATLVGCLVGPRNGGVFFHIGDGAACAMSSTDRVEAVISPPENGSYAETTFFVTQDNWREHLRFTPFRREHDLVLLMSDGVTPMALKGPIRAPEPVLPFIQPIDRYLRTVSREEGEAALRATLTSDKVRDITGDDKTVVWAVRHG